MDDFLAQALELHEQGFAVHWLRPEQKIPVDTGWSTAAIMDEASLRVAYRRGYNIGFRPGKWSIVNGKEVCVLDVDVRGGERYSEEAYAAAKAMLGDRFIPNVITGSQVGRHQYLTFAKGRSPSRAATTLRRSDLWVDRKGDVCSGSDPQKRPAWVIELLSTGKNVVLPPSIHPETGKPYVWTKA